MKTENERDKEDATAAICGCCKRAVFIAVTATLGKSDHAEIGELAASGCDIKHVPVSDARKLDFGCECKK